MITKTKKIEHRETDRIGILTCPRCKSKQKTEIPDNKCLLSYNCKKCKNMIESIKKCCVFCEYGNIKCKLN